MVLVSDCRLILPRFHCTAIKKTGLHVSFLVWGSIFFDTSFRGFPLLFLEG